MGSGFTFLIIPTDGKRRIHRFHIKRKTIKRFMVGSISFGLLFIIILVINLILVNKTRNYKVIENSNRILKGELESLKGKIIEMDKEVKEFKELKENLLEIEVLREMIRNGEEEVIEDDEGMGGVSIPLEHSFNVEDDIDIDIMIKEIEENLYAIKDELLLLKEMIPNLPLLKPVRGSYSSYFGIRKSPIDFGFEFHTGLDIDADLGDEIHAAADGLVEFSNWRRGYGYLIIIDHGYGIKTYYGHNSRNLVHSGEYVRRGDVIGLVGSTGNTTGSHLHFEIRKDGIPLDPLDFLLGE